MVRRAAELAGVMAATFAANYVQSLALAPEEQPRTLLSYVVAVLVPLGLLLIYWFWVEPRNRETRIKGRRLRNAWESDITRDYKESPGDISPDGRMHDPAPDVYRLDRYKRAGVADLYVPSAGEGLVKLFNRAKEAEALVEQVHKAPRLTAKLKAAITQWEKAAEDDLWAYADGWRQMRRVKKFAVPSALSYPEQRDVRDAIAKEGKVLLSVANGLRKRAQSEANASEDRPL